MQFLLVAALLALASSLALAEPVPGVFRSRSAGGAVCDGRASFARERVGSREAMVLNVQSWDGRALGRQWKMRCAALVASGPPDSSGFDRARGTGVIVIQRRSTGGTFLLFDDGAVGWGAGTGSLDSTVVTWRICYESFVPVRTDVALLAIAGFSHDACRLEVAVVDGVQVGQPMDGPAPNQYPEFLSTTCQPTPPDERDGAWLDAEGITMEIVNPGPGWSRNSGYARSIYQRLCTLWRLGKVGQGEESTGSGSFREE